MRRSRWGGGRRAAPARAAAPSRSRARRAPRRRASPAASSASARSRSRSVGAASSGHVSAESGRRRVQRRTSSGSKTPGPPPRTGSARAGCRRRSPPRARGRAAERARAGGVEEVAVAADRVGPLQAGAALVERAAGVVVEERRGVAAPRQAALLEAEDEDDVEAARARAEQVDDGDAARLVAAHRPERLPLDGGDDLLAGELAREVAPALELAEQARDAPRRRAGRGAAPPRPGGPSTPYAPREHPVGEVADRLAPDRRRRGRRRAPAAARRAGARTPRRRARASGRRGRAAVLRRSRRHGVRGRRTASAGR